MKRLFPSALVALSLLAAAATASAGEKGQFPMKADIFQQHLDAGIARARAHLEERLQKKQVSGEEAKQARARLDSVAARIQAAAHKATADGVVTADEAKAVHEISRELRKHKKSSKKAAS